MRHINSFLQLTKPTIMLLVVFSGGTALALEGSLLSDPFSFFLVLAGLYLTGGSANALNQCLEAEIDAKMTRTNGRRPLPQGRLSLPAAYTFSIIIGVLGVICFALVFNLLSAALSLGTILFYSLFYTLYLKPNTEQNIVIGGAAGAMAPIIAWAAATGTITLIPIVLFAIIFFWTPAHFWALALYCKDDYEKVGLPMMPVVRGNAYTFRMILYYSFAAIAVSLSMVALGSGIFYLVGAVLLGVQLVRKALQAQKLDTTASQRSLFGYSIVYLFALFIVIIVDAALPRM